MEEQSKVNPKETQKKRRSRWDNAELVKGSESSQQSSTNSDEVKTKRKKRPSRWGEQVSTTPTPKVRSLKPTAETGILGLLPGIPQGMTQNQLKELSDLQRRLKVVNVKLATLETEAARMDALPRGHPNRSPSPPPIYSVDGVRTNTRAVRWREQYCTERQDCLEKIMELYPSLRPPGFVKRKRTKKIYVPVDDHPTYNFIGLIIGPRGKTQKEMESKTNCKIAIRGKGSVKEGARGRRDGKPMEGDDEALHVVITGDDQASVDHAGILIHQMLVVIDDEKNVHKQQQLRELALLNGTLKDEEYCHLCAEKGHRSFECPKRFVGMKKNLVSVKCAICGDTSHPTRDCVQKQVDQTQVDRDYLSFIAELDGKPAPSSAQVDTAAAAICLPVPSPSNLSQTAQTINANSTLGTTNASEVTPQDSSDNVATVPSVSNTLLASAAANPPTLHSGYYGVQQQQQAIAYPQQSQLYTNSYAAMYAQQQYAGAQQQTNTNTSAQGWEGAGANWWEGMY